MTDRQSERENIGERHIGKIAASGVAWTALLSLCGRAAVLVSQLALAKLLVPEDFGILGLAYTITAFFSVLTGFGVEQVFLQRKDKMYLWGTQAFTISLFSSIVVAIAAAIYAPIGAEMYHNEHIIPLVWVLAASMPLAALSVVPQAKLKLMLRFKFLAAYGAWEVISAQIITIGLAWAGFGAISFVIAVPLLAIIRAAIFWKLAPVSLRPLRFAKGWGHMMRRGTNVFGVSILVTAISQGDYVTLGLVASAHIVGVYFFAFKLVAQPMQLLSTNFTNVLRPTLIAMKGDSVRQCNAALRTGELLGLLTIPIGFLQAAIAQPGLQLLFGSRWNEAIPLIQILSIGLPLDSISWAAGSLLESRGNFLKSFKYQLITAPFFFVFVGLGAWLDSSIGVAIGVTTYYTLHPIFLSTLVFSKENLPLNRILACFYFPILFSVAAIGPAFWISTLSTFSGHLGWQLLITCAVGCVLYICLVYRFRTAVFNDIRFRLMKTLKLKN